MRSFRSIRNDSGFSEFEFLGLVASGLLIAGLLAHFIFDQSIQVERLNALVHRDSVRLMLESRLVDINVLKKSAKAMPDTPDNISIKACILGNEGNKDCKIKNKCCESRQRRAMPVFDLGDQAGVIGGTHDVVACLNEQGEPTKEKCFANSRVVIEPVCAEGEEKCRQASALLIRYQLQFLPAFLQAEPELSTLERTISVLVDETETSAVKTK
ncbi:hypothetical protein BH10BDE1_BH10BDE1_13020 [soil metagenome]